MLQRTVHKNMVVCVHRLKLGDVLRFDFKVSANPKSTVLHNFGFLYHSIDLRNSFRLKKKTPKNVIRTRSYQGKTILPS